MWLYRCIFLLFLYIVNCMPVQGNVRVKFKDEKDPELDFTDVVKNITQVNKDLQELISNYEQLKKLYELNANSETEASDTEIDEVFKANDMESSKKPGEFPATQMFWSGDEESSNSDNVNDETHKRKQTVQPVKKVEAEGKGIMTKADESSSTDQSTVERTDILSSESQNTYSKTLEIEPVSEISPTIIFIDTHKAIKETVEVKPKRSIFVTTSKKPYNIIMDNQFNNKTRTVKKGDHSDGFSKQQNIWNEMLKNKPIILQHSYINYKNRARKQLKASLRSIDTEISDVNSTTKQSKSFKDVDPLVNFDQIAEEIVVKKHQFKTDILRTAYGDACLKLVVTKCNKACVSAGKAFCRKHNCKNNFINKYKSASNRGCRKEFRGDGITTATPASDDVQYRRKQLPTPLQRENATITTKKAPDTEGGHIDPTKGEYLSGACLSSAQDSDKQRKRTSRQNESHVSLKTNPDMAFNILRDKYEDACKKISAGKCRRACNFAFEKACEGDCNSEKKKHAKKACRSQCKSAYKLRHDDSDSDSYSDLDIDKS